MVFLFWFSLALALIAYFVFLFFGLSALLSPKEEFLIQPPKKNISQIRYPKELRQAVLTLIPILQAAKTKNDPELLAAVDNLKDSHPRFSDCARGLISLKFRENDRS